MCLQTANWSENRKGPLDMLGAEKREVEVRGRQEIWAQQYIDLGHRLTNILFGFTIGWSTAVDRLK